MRLAYDHQIFCLQKVGGISRYFCKLTEQLHNLDQTIGVFAPFYRNQYLSNLSAQWVHGRKVLDYPKWSADLSVALNGYISRRRLTAWRPDVVHETYFSKVPSALIHLPNVVTVFDMIDELGLTGDHLAASEFKNTNKYAAVQRASHVVCISEHTRQDLIQFFGIKEEKITTIHLGCDQSAMPEADCDPDNDHGASVDHAPLNLKPYLLYVGTRNNYKNFFGLLRGVSAAARLKNSFNIIAFGGGAFTSAEERAMSDLMFSPDQIQQINGDDFLLAKLYRGASALVYPSIYEGFGLPPLEAMSNRCPVVSSNTSSMPEIIGDAAEFFDPAYTDSMVSAIENVVFSTQRRQELISKGIHRVKLFTWKSCAEKHLDLYRSMSARIEIIE